MNAIDGEIPCSVAIGGRSLHFQFSNLRLHRNGFCFPLRLKGTGIVAMNINSPATTAARHESILVRLQEDFDLLPNALARIAKYILENPEKVLHQSVAELGEFAGSGEASILRLCRQIGFSGFRDFKLALAAEIGRPGLHSARPRTAGSSLAGTA